MAEASIDKKTKLAVLFLILIVLLGGAYGLTRLLFSRSTDLSLVAKEIDSVVSANLLTAGIQHGDMQKNFVPKQSGKLNWEQIEVVINIDEAQSIEEISRIIRRGLNPSKLTIKEDSRNLDETLHVQFSFYFDTFPIYQIMVSKKLADIQYKNVSSENPGAETEETASDVYANLARIPPSSETAKENEIDTDENRPAYPRIALVVDDVGYDLENALKLLNLGRPMTLSIFPQLKYTKHIAEIANEMEYEVMMHLPMDSGKRLRRNPGFITPDMTEEQLRWVLDRDFESLPYVIGVNNHQGSRMTADEQAMSRVMRYLADRGLFFIDSRTTKESVAYRVAKETGLRSAENDLFLDNEKDISYIKGQIEQLIEEALRKGDVIGVCHVHPTTIQALQEMFPVIDEKGIELVFASELVK